MRNGICDYLVYDTAYLDGLFGAIYPLLLILQ